MMFFIIFFVVGSTLFLSERLNINGINDHLNNELNRAANLAIKEAMYDSERMDSISKFDEKVAYKAFYDYLYDDLQLDRSLRKYSGEKLAYTVVIGDLHIDGNTARLYLKATAYVPSMFGFGMDWQLPIDVRSRNMRVDGL